MLDQQSWEEARHVCWIALLDVSIFLLLEPSCILSFPGTIICLLDRLIGCEYFCFVSGLVRLIVIVRVIVRVRARVRVRVRIGCVWLCSVLLVSHTLQGRFTRFNKPCAHSRHLFLP